MPLHRKHLAEALGTLLLLATVVGSGIMAQTLSGGNVALALLCNTIATGAILVGMVAAAVTFAVGQLLITFARPIWLKLGVAIVFVAPAAVAGFHATHGIVKHLMPSDVWQITFSVIGAIAVGITAFARVAGMAKASGPTSRDLARA